MLALACVPRSNAQNFTDVKPSPQQVAWQDLEIGAIIHFGPNTFMDGSGEMEPPTIGLNRPPPIQNSGCGPPKPRHQVRCLRCETSRRLLSLADGTEPILRQVQPMERRSRRLIGEVAAAARKYSLKFGVYLSPWIARPGVQGQRLYDRYISRC